MKNIGLLIFLLTISNYTYSQTPDWSTSVASIFYQHCTSCHHPNGIGPFDLINYNDAVANAQSIVDMVEQRKMPPWPANPHYRRFANETLLDSIEIVKIKEWVLGGTPVGNIALAPTPPTYNAGGSLLDTIDYTVQIPPYTLSSNGEIYRYFAIRPNFTDTVYISQIEVIPGLPDLVHHADIHYDLTGQSYTNDSMSSTPGFGGGLVSNYYINAWQPGGNIVKYPPGWGVAVPPGADFVLEIHYGAGGAGQTDTTKMNLRFITSGINNFRAIKVGWLLNNPIPAQGPLVIPPNVITNFDQQSQQINGDKSFIAVCPHMHGLGKSYKVWFKTLSGDSVPLVDIPEWEFHWQKYYFFRKIQKVPSGSMIYAKASFDNTANNPHNPNDPPATVYAGALTTDEMLMTYFIFANYAPGDEDIVIDSTLLASLKPEGIGLQNTDINLHPNPAQQYFELNSNEENINQVMIYDINGALINQYQINNQHAQIDIQMLSAGIYFIQANCNSKTEHFKLIKQ
jgi:hypothetical protein